MFTVFVTVKLYKSIHAQQDANLKDKENAYKILAGKYEWKGALGRANHRWVVG
jgi:hypothetical protein